MLVFLFCKVKDWLEFYEEEVVIVFDKRCFFFFVWELVFDKREEKIKFCFEGIG